MKLKFKESKPDYSKYHFPYCVYGKLEKDDSLDEVYEQGFLPSRKELNLFYLARSTRINLSEFSPTSENRRILRKTEYLDFEIIDLNKFEYHYSIGKMGKDFYDKRGGGKFSAYKIKWLFTSGSCSHVIRFTDDYSESKVAGYCLVNRTENILHYAYPFYDLDYLDKNAGIGMMTRSVQEAKKARLRYCYLGTCYTKSSLYKTQFEGFEYFDGEKWVGDVEKLKKLVRDD